MPAEFMSDFLDRTAPFVYLHLRRTWGAGDAGTYSERLFMAALTGQPWPAASTEEDA
ncbi:MAG: hypothetical protein U5Q44_05425 [Dehalococcoidia bacterium]|nr:hypothetical protein [Dehalococcoidia bacterium]